MSIISAIIYTYIYIYIYIYTLQQVVGKVLRNSKRVTTKCGSMQRGCVEIFKMAGDNYENHVLVLLFPFFIL